MVVGGRRPGGEGGEGGGYGGGTVNCIEMRGLWHFLLWHIKESSTTGMLVVCLMMHNNEQLQQLSMVQLLHNVLQQPREEVAVAAIVSSATAITLWQQQRYPGQLTCRPGHKCCG